jgi:hypothetical protein
MRKHERHLIVLSGGATRAAIFRLAPTWRAHTHFTLAGHAGLVYVEDHARINADVHRHCGKMTHTRMCAYVHMYYHIHGRWRTLGADGEMMYTCV